ncbi:hypothetical protein [Flectobacillus roseus]|uniref:Uncharacterized protein n=1 Tax=Flectobacillus roseus TaxID=502259 RepID=A0ABT6Y3C8_9BACT|nr:hypothetical protein [Flectobacillus roseus]MDI9858063.1 hypothetical protein [Flectobacillus roseus]
MDKAILAVIVEEKIDTNNLIVNINLIKMKRTLVLGVLVGFIACNQKNSNEKANTIDNKKINSLLEKMYSEDGHNDVLLNDTMIFSKDIVVLNMRCDSITQADIRRIARSNHPTDKPLSREGSRVSSLHEGVTDFKINNIKSVNDKTEVTVTLSNKNYPTQKQWIEKIIFTDQNGLKIENIYFNQNMLHTTEPNLKKSLINFIKQIDQQPDNNKKNSQ